MNLFIIRKLIAYYRMRNWKLIKNIFINCRVNVVENSYRNNEFHSTLEQ